jgi:hypothetical protein
MYIHTLIPSSRIVLEYTDDTSSTTDISHVCDNLTIYGSEVPYESFLPKPLDVIHEEEEPDATLSQ